MTSVTPRKSSWRKHRPDSPYPKRVSFNDQEVQMEPATSVAKKEQTSQGVPTPPNHDPQLASQKGPAVTIGPPALRETSTSPIRKVSLRSPRKSGRR